MYDRHQQRVVYDRHQQRAVYDKHQQCVVYDRHQQCVVVSCRHITNSSVHCAPRVSPPAATVYRVRLLMTLTHFQGYSNVIL